jgi:hypothetical protein
VNPEALFQQLVDVLTREEGVRLVDPGGTPFGGQDLVVDDRVFAVLRGEELLVCLGYARVQELATTGEALPATAGDRSAEDWAALPLEQNPTWEDHAREALDLVRS